MTSVADLPDDGTADQYADQPYTHEEVDQSKPFWTGDFFIGMAEDDDREATIAEVAEAFGSIMKFTREDEMLWLVQADWIDIACGGSEVGSLELQRGDVVLNIDWV